MDTNCNSPPELPSNGSGSPSGTPPPEQTPESQELKNDWSILDPSAQGRIVGGLIAMSKPGATTTRRLPDGRTITTKVKRRDALRAMELATALGKLNLEQQKDDHQANVHDNKFTLNDVVSPVMDVAAPLLAEEVQRREVSCVAELPDEVIHEITAAAREAYEAEHGPEPRRGPKPLKQAPRAQRQTWGIPLDGQRMMMARLQDMTDPQGQEYHLMHDRERLRAVRVLVRIGRLVLAQMRWDRQVDRGEQPFDWAAGVAWAKQKEKEELARIRQEDEEWARREEQERQGGAS
jgi:hypothetical protein